MRKPNSVVARECHWLAVLVCTITLLTHKACAGDPAQDAISSTPFAKVPISNQASQIRDALYHGHWDKAAQLSGRIAGGDPAAQIYRTAGMLIDTDLVDPMTRVNYTYDFAVHIGAFIPNGRAHPATEYLTWFTRAVEQSPDLAPVVADAICLAIGTQLVRAIEGDRAIVLSDDILFARVGTSRPMNEEHRPFSDTGRLPDEVFSSNPNSRKPHHQLKQMMFLQNWRKQEKQPYFGGGTWLDLKAFSARIDPECVDRWRVSYRNIAADCTKKNRFSSGGFIICHASHEGSAGGWRYLLDAAERTDPNDPASKPAITNLKIAFASLGEAVRLSGYPVPEDENFRALAAKLQKLGDAAETRYAWEVAGLGAP
jgi:hypothetical protein